MQLFGEEFFSLIKLLLPIILFIAFGIWYLVDTYNMMRFEGKIKRGIKVWSRELPFDTWQYLLSLKQDVIMEGKTFFKKDFIRVDNDEILIHANPKRSHSTWLCIGYMDLKSPMRELEYRMSLPGIIFLIPFTIFGILLLLISFNMYKKAIDSFIERRVSEVSLKPATFNL